MATLTRSNSRVAGYKDYVNFLGGYKTGKKDEEIDNFPLSTSDSSSSSLSSDTPDFAKKSCQSYNSFLENSKTKKFTSVKPNFEEKPVTKKSEIFIEIQPPKSVSEVSKIFENRKSPARGQKINSKISIFEKPKVAEKPALAASPNGFVPPPPEFRENGFAAPPPPPPMPVQAAPVPKVHSNGATPPKVSSNGATPPKVPSNGATPPKVPSTGAPKLQATLTKGPQTRYSVSNPNGAVPSEIDRNDPLVRKLVYGTLRGLYGAYHDKASDMLATLPRNMVVKSNGVQDRIEQIAANGDLDKLNGRVNPKLEQE